MKFGDHYLHLVLVNKFQKAKRKFWKALRFFEPRLFFFLRMDHFIILTNR